MNYPDKEVLLVKRAAEDDNNDDQLDSDGE